MKRMSRMEKSTRNKLISSLLVVAIILIIITCVTSCKKSNDSRNAYLYENVERITIIPEDEIPLLQIENEDTNLNKKIEMHDNSEKFVYDNNENNNENELQNDGVEIYFFDVGQADSIFIQSGSDTMLIDAGNNPDGKLIVKYLDDILNVDNIDYLVATHPHEDHIGGIDDIIDNFDIGRVLMPATETTTKSYENMQKSLKAKKIKEENPKVGDTFTFGDIGKITIFSIEDDYTELNFTSIVLRFDYGDSSFLFTGDAILENEIEMMNSPLNLDLDVDVLKVGHHGSTTSSGLKFLKRVSPLYSIISVGKDNKYGLPNEKTIKSLKSINSVIYRTDHEGTIKISTEGKDGNDEYKIETIKTNVDYVSDKREK